MDSDGEFAVENELQFWTGMPLHGLHVKAALK